MNRPMNSGRAVLAVMVLVIGSLPVPGALASGFDGRYRAQVGDLNGDGRNDIYLRHAPRLFPADGDQGRLIPLPGDVGEFLLQQDPTGRFALVTSLTLAQRAAARQWAFQGGIAAAARDFNADDAWDLILTGVGSVIPGARDVIIFAADTRGAPPVAVRNLDESLQSFVTDVQGFLEDPNYFDSGVSVQCGVQYRYVWVYYLDYGWVLELWPYWVCYYVFDPAGFSIDALEFLNYLVPFLQIEKLIAQVTEAVELDRVFREVFGVEVLRGVLVDGGNDDTDPYCWQAHPCVQYERFGRLIDILVRLDKETVDYCEAGPAHHYTVETAICSVGSPGCGLDVVYKEQLSHPAPGYEANLVPVRDGQPGFAELGLPGPLENLGEIIFEVEPGDLLHRNRTTERHVLHPGLVVRQTVNLGGTAMIRTDGTGTGGCKVANEYLGRAAFKALDFYILGHVVNGFSPNHPPVSP